MINLSARESLIINSYSDLIAVNDKIFSAKLNENELQIFPLTKKI